MNNIKKLIKEALLNHKHNCGCGCHGKCAKAPMLNENLGTKVIMTENMQYHINNKKALTENTFRYGSKAFLDLWAEARYLYSRDAINLSGEDKIIVETTHLGEYGLFEGEMVPLDLPIMEEMDEAISDEIKVGDIVGNTVQGFNFKVLNIKGDKLEVENTKTGKKFETYIDNMYLPTMEELTSESNKNDLDEMSLNSYGVEEFLSNIKDRPEMIKKLGFNSYDYLKTYIEDADYKEWSEIKNEFKSLNEAKEGKHVLNKPKRGGSKKFYVYVRNPKTKKIKKVSFGMAGGGLKAKINNPKARQAFSKRHDCPNKTDKTKASYWSCRLPRYAKVLGLKSNFTGFW
jgi:hypothetical protein